MKNDQRIQLSENELVALSEEQLETTVGGAGVSQFILNPILIRGIPWEPIGFTPGNINPGNINPGNLVEGIR
jgi:hypothetical protein